MTPAPRTPLNNTPATMPQRRNLSFLTFDEIAEDVRRLRRDGYVQTGLWSLPQVCHHLTRSLKWSMRPGPFPPDTPEQQSSTPQLAQILNSGRLPDGLTAPDHMQPPAEAGAGAVDEFLDELERYGTHQGELAPHRLFGRRSRDVIHQLVRIHCAHHLSHLVPARSTNG